MDAVPKQRSDSPRVRPDAPVEVSLGPVPFLSATAALALPLAVIGVVVAVLVPLVPWWAGLLLAVAAAVGLVWSRLQSAHEVLVGRLKEHTATITSVRLTNMVSGLALAAGVEEPEAFLLNDDAVNASVVSRNGTSTIAVTRGLLNVLEPVELEGIIAELLVRVRNGDAEAATIASAVFRLPILGPISALITGPAASIGVSHLLDDGRYVDADLEAVALTRYPPGLLRALAKAKGADHSVAGVHEGLDAIWLINPADAASRHSEAIRSALDLRIDVLTEL